MSIRIISIFFTFLCWLESNAQKNQELVYAPIPNANIEEAFPVAATILMGNYKIVIAQIDWGKHIMTSNYFEYSKLLVTVRSKYLVSIDETNTLNVEIIDTQMFDNQKKEWISEHYGNKEKKLKAGFINDININLKKPETIKSCQGWFYKDLYINSLFFEHATELAGNRWFESFLKDKLVKWNLIFGDIKKNSSDNQYKYLEEYRIVVNSIATSNTTNFNIIKYTNSDKNTLTSKNSSAILEGYCRTLTYQDGLFNISLTDNLESPIPVNNLLNEQKSSEKSVLDYAEKLKQLKGLLDQGIITKDEYEAEKKKILNSK